MMSLRLRSGLSASLKHLGCSLLVALAASALVLLVWYPYPYREISGGRALFILLITVDVVMGPLLTLVAFNPAKRRSELVRDLGVIIVLQLAALGYGLWTVHEARPVVLSFEGNRFRVVSASELEHEALGEAPEGLGHLSETGPRLIAAKLLEPSDPGYIESLKQSLGGLSPSHRPSRWRPFKEQATTVASAKQLKELMARRRDQVVLLKEAAGQTGRPLEQLGYWPLQSRTHSDWIVIVDKRDGRPVGYAPVEGW